MQHDEKWALSKCMAICSKAEKCISDIQRKLDGWDLSPESTDWVVKELITQKFIDEERYARHYVRDKFRFNRWGRTKITFMLRGKKIPVSSIKSALAEIDGDEYFEVLKSLLSQKMKKIKFENEYDKKARLVRFAQGHGFEYDLINLAVEEISSDENSNPD